MLTTTGPGDRQTIKLSISDMTCASCVRGVEKAIEKVPGVSGATVNLATEKADVTFDGAPDIAAIAEAVRGAGYGVGEEVLEFPVEGMTCASCIGRVEKALKAVPGVLDATANLAQERARVRLAKGAATFDDLAAAIERTGYKAVRVAADTPGEDDRRAAEADALKRDLLTSTKQSACRRAVSFSSCWRRLCLPVPAGASS
jgi:Cu+-exporting ATPase